MRPSAVQVEKVTSTTTSGRSQCTRDSSRGEPNRLSRGGGAQRGWSLPVGLNRVASVDVDVRCRAHRGAASERTTSRAALPT